MCATTTYSWLYVKPASQQENCKLAGVLANEVQQIISSFGKWQFQWPSVCTVRTPSSQCMICYNNASFFINGSLSFGPALTCSLGILRRRLQHKAFSYTPRTRCVSQCMKETTSRCWCQVKNKYFQYSYVEISERLL